MKLRMLNSYPKFRELKDAQGNVVLDKETQKAKGNLVTLFRYAVCDATPQELALYKKFKTQDGKNYYREEKIGNKSYPLWHGDYLGREVTLRGYTRQDGKLGFSADTTEVDELVALGKRFPDMQETLNAKIVNLQLSGKRIILDENNQDDEEVEEVALSEEATPEAGDADAQDDTE